MVPGRGISTTPKAAASVRSAHPRVVPTLTDDELLAHLLELNLARSQG
jgi:hypothetical protein